jgi:hypothetical protein
MRTLAYRPLYLYTIQTFTEIPRTRFERVTYCLGGGHSTYIGDIESVWGGNSAPDVHFFIYAI